MAASNTRFTQNSLGQSKNPIDSDHGIYRYNAATSSHCSGAGPLYCGLVVPSLAFSRRETMLGG
jgi:hypothetical protein